MSYINRRFAAAFSHDSFAARLGLRPGDEVPFSPNIRLAADRIFVRHTDGDGEPLGWEVYSEGPDGRPLVHYTRGARKGLVLTRFPYRGGCEVVLAEGALAALAAAALDRDAAGKTKMFVGLGGHWNAGVAEEVDRLTTQARAAHVAIAISGHHPVGQRMRQQALADLDALRLPVSLAASPPGGWRAALIAARRGPTGPGR